MQGVPWMIYLSFWSKVPHFYKIMILCHINFGNQATYIHLHAINILHWFSTEGFTSMLIFFKVLNFCFQLFYQTIFLLDEWSRLFNLPHQFHSKLNVALILRLHLFSCFPQFSNGMDDFLQVSLETVFNAISILYLPHILLGFN